MSIAVLGAGAFGTALAIALAQGGRSVTLWARNAAHVEKMNESRVNAQRLPDAAFPPGLRVTHDLQDIAATDTILLAIPMQNLHGFASDHATLLSGKTLVACCKGIDLTRGTGPVTILQNTVPDATHAILTGPSFAHDIAIGLPTALTLASTKDASALQQALSTKSLRIYRTADVIGAELGGALKNVMAIACGAAIGAGLGDSARAALITRGFAEMQRMALRLGARADTLAGLSGFGDLVLTCTSEGSRNFRFGLALGRGDAFDPDITVEGADTARACLGKAQTLNIDMPITQAVVGLMAKQLTIETAMDQLLARPLKEETC